MNNFQLAKDQPQAFAQDLLWIFADFNQALLVKVLLIKKDMYWEGTVKLIWSNLLNQLMCTANFETFLFDHIL